MEMPGRSLVVDIVGQQVTDFVRRGGRRISGSVSRCPMQVCRVRPIRVGRRDAPGSGKLGQTIYS